MKKYISVVLSVILAFSLSVMPRDITASGVSKLEKSEKAAQSVSVSEKKAIEKSTKAEKGEFVTLDDKSIVDFEDETDVFYEPTDESVTVMEDSSAYINDAISVFFRDGTTDAEKQSVVDSVNGEIVGETGFMNQYEIKIQSANINEINALCDEVMTDSSVEFASCILANEVKPDYAPEDPWNGYTNWSENANGSYSSYSNWWIKAIDADKAWDYKDKFSHIKIGIVDSGFDTEHEDLQGKISFPSKFFEKRNAPDDHGTHVAGIIGATHNNNVGISGIVDDCELVCADWHANEEQGQHWINDVRITTGFVNAVRSGAKVINFSLGSSGTITNGTTDRYKFVKDIEAKYTSFVMAKLLQRGYDFICCQSAGNGTEMKDGSSYAVDASNNGNFCTITKENAIKTVIGVKPQDIIDRIIIVASAAFTGYNTYVQSSFSNGGSQVSICAPGSSIYSTIFDLEDENRHYGYMSGTSMAAPIVTGVTSLVWSINQSFTGAQVKHFVCDIENTKYMVADNESESHLPTGEIPMVNAKLAVEAALRANGDYGAAQGKADNPVDPTDENIKIEIVSEQTGDIFRFLTSENGEFRIELPEGSYTITKIGDVEYNEKFEVVRGETKDLGTFNLGDFTPDSDKLMNIVVGTVMNNL
ncbi:MAG: S8 family serine peptidase [Clostridia bacterium]|nr:S8 family serine peptidase [Clostridia bacterium]